MGLFDEFRQAGNLQQQVTLGPAEAFAAIMLLAIAADGHLSNDEINLLNSTLGRMKLFRSYSWDVMRRMFDNLCGTLRNEGAQVLFGAAMATLPHDLYETVFAVATDLILADGQVSEEEEQLLGSLCRALEIPQEQVNKIIEVMLIKNRG
jgi:uncharacterized tellurite resistance protein B-like protein